ncbi:MAG: C-GCAxxG-C-C family protein [Nitrososphaerota archaeon]|nr:C-GCAxxG-C-C family protein [Aigarchaeota archaeon]MDW8077146.1 C-GCAxxG-C-C family protein [Nitrososphaerota archaeon]
MYQKANRLVNRAAKLAKILGGEFGGCSQMTLKALQETFGVVDQNVFMAASPLAGGVARSGEVCGALLGALMFVGMLHGRKRLERTSESEDYSRCMDLATVVCDEFKQTYGSIRCRDIHMRLFGRVYDLRNPEDLKVFVESGAMDKCADVMAKAAEIAAKHVLKHEMT